VTPPILSAETDAVPDTSRLVEMDAPALNVLSAVHVLAADLDAGPPAPQLRERRASGDTKLYAKCAGLKEMEPAELNGREPVRPTATVIPNAPASAPQENLPVEESQRSLLVPVQAVRPEPKVFDADAYPPTSKFEERRLDP